MSNEQQIINALSREVKTLQGRLREAAQNVYQMNIGIKSVSTLAALYKAQLKEVLDETPEENMPSHVRDKATKLLAASHMEPVNEILRLNGELVKANSLTAAQVNMIEQLEKECRDLGRKLEDKA